MKKQIKWTALAFAFISEICLGQGITKLVNGTVADADVLNQNFAANNEIIESVSSRVDSLETKVEGRGCSVTDLEGVPWLTTYALGESFRYTVYRFTATGQGGLVEYEYTGAAGGTSVSGSGTGTFGFNSQLCEVSIVEEIASPAQLITTIGYLSQSKDALIGISCSNVNGCISGNAIKLRLPESSNTSPRLPDPSILGLPTPAD